MEVTLQNLINRMNVNKRFLNEHPENKELLERKIAETKELIIQCLMNNDGNPLLEKIILKLKQ